jgi:hypothetical protein
MMWSSSLGRFTHNDSHKIYLYFSDVYSNFHVFWKFILFLGIFK